MEWAEPPLLVLQLVQQRTRQRLPQLPSHLPHSPLGFFGTRPTIHKLMATVEIHGATTFILVICLKKFHQGAALPRFTPHETSSRQLHRVGGRRPLHSVRARGKVVKAGRVQCLTGLWQGAHQLALTASMSLTKFWAKHIPKI